MHMFARLKKFILPFKTFISFIPKNSTIGKIFFHSYHFRNFEMTNYVSPLRLLSCSFFPTMLYPLDVHGNWKQKFKNSFLKFFFHSKILLSFYDSSFNLRFYMHQTTSRMMDFSNYRCVSYGADSSPLEDTVPFRKKIFTKKRILINNLDSHFLSTVQLRLNLTKLDNANSVSTALLINMIKQGRFAKWPTTKISTPKCTPRHLNP